MRWSQFFIPTLKETPADALVPSHRLMLRAGLIRQVAAGSYAYLPLGYRVLRKAERIVREEMNLAGAIELNMPAMHPMEWWEQTGRVEAMGDVLVRLGALTVGQAGVEHRDFVAERLRYISDGFGPNSRIAQGWARAARGVVSTGFETIGGRSR